MEKELTTSTQGRFLNNGGRGFFDRGKKIGKREKKAARRHCFPEKTRATKQLIRLIRLIRRDSSRSDNRVTRRGHQHPDSQTLDQEKRDHRVPNRSKGGNPKGLEHKEKLLQREEFEVF